MNNKEIKLSVLIPAHNFANYIIQCLDSILDQKVNFKYEILCCDDYSSDGSLEILKSYQNKFPDIVKVIENKSNLGCAKTTFKMHSMAKGEYFTVIDGDDYLVDENRFQWQVDFLEKNRDFSAVAGNTIIHHQNGEKPDELLIQQEISATHDIYNFINASTYFHTSAILYRNIYKNNIPKFLKHKYGRGDWIRTIIHAQHGKIGFVNKTVSVYRIHQEGIWSKMTDFERFVRNTNACFYFNKFLKYRYNEEFLNRIELFINHIYQKFPEQIKKNPLLKLRYHLFLSKQKRGRKALQKKLKNENN